MNDSLETLAAEEYYLMWEKLNKGQISEGQWIDYCMTTLGKIMLKHTDVFMRLKNR